MGPREWPDGPVRLLILSWLDAQRETVLACLCLTVVFIAGTNILGLSGMGNYRDEGILEAHSGRA